MRWQRLFADLEAELAAGAAGQAVERVAELTRAELSTVAFIDRLRAEVGGAVRVHLRDGSALGGRLTDVGGSWLLLDGDGEHVVPLGAVVAVSSARDGRRVAGPPTAVERRLGLGSVLRALARDRAKVTLRASSLTAVGLVAGVGADHLELAVLGEDGLRPSGQVLSVRFEALDLLSRR